MFLSCRESIFLVREGTYFFVLDRKITISHRQIENFDFKDSNICLFLRIFNNSTKLCYKDADSKLKIA